MNARTEARSPETVREPRRIARVVRGRPTSDGAGVRLTRVIGGPELPDLDPFLLLDEIRGDEADAYGAGFPNHPHRGFETVTYMLAGRMRHRDSRGHEGLLLPGSVQWMTAGRGLVHSEMPEQQNGLLWGFQLWVNLPARDKRIEPRYQEFPREEVPELALGEGATVRVIAGEIDGVEGPVRGVATAPIYLDVELRPGGDLEIDVPADRQGFAYAYDGAIAIQGDPLATGELGVLAAGDRLRLASDEGGRALVVAGRPLRERVVRYGPFVMNTRQEIAEAIDDFNAGRMR
jgi:quercetin 2,3-dioxygenase